MSHRIDDCFAALAAAGKKALIPYIAAGDPHPEATVPLMHALVRGGANILELGVPFSDPMADGPVIQRAAERAIRHGVGLRRTLLMVEEFRHSDQHTPVVLMGYANPIERMGMDRFIDAAARVGVDGVLVVDYPPEESQEFAKRLLAQGINAIFLVAPTTPPERLDLIAALATGYVYYVSLKGTTGAAHLDLADIAAHLPALRERFSIPLGVGFGIRDATSAAAVAELSDAVVIGSRMITELEDHPGTLAEPALERLTRMFRHAIDQRATPEPQAEVNFELD